MMRPDAQALPSATTGPISTTKRCWTSGCRTFRSPSTGRWPSGSRSFAPSSTPAGSASRCISICRRVVHARRRHRHRRSRSIWRIRGSKSSRKRRCSRSKAANTSGACASCGTRRGTPSTTRTGCACGGSGAHVFGSPSKPYPEFYTPKPYSKSFVLHLDSWYAQSHPGRGLRRDVRRLADAEQRVAAALCRVDGAEQARIHGRADALAARSGAARRQPG